MVASFLSLGIGLLDRMEMEEKLKTLFVIALLSAPAMSCPKGCEPYQGICACSEAPETAPDVKPSDEKPPKGGSPEWMTGTVKADMPPNLSDKDRRSDLERTDAEHSGKKAAGLE